MMTSITLTGQTLTREQVCQVAHHATPVFLDPTQLKIVQKTADFLAQQVKRGEPIYGVSTGFGSNADKLLGARRARADLAENPQQDQETLLEELQRNLIITHAVCVGEPLSATVVRAMLVIRINTLMRGHSGIRPSTLQALVDILNAQITPIVPCKGSVGASGDLAPLSHLAIVLLGGGEAFYNGTRMSGADALQQAGLKPIKLSYKEGLALNNGTAQMLACAVLSIHKLDYLIKTADLAAAMTLQAFAGRSSAFREDVHALRPHPGQVHSAANLRQLLSHSTLIDIPYHLVPRFHTWHAKSWQTPEEQAYRFDIRWDYVPPDQRHGRELFYQRFMPFKGGKKHQPQDAYSLRCIPQVHGAVRDALEQAKRIIDIELNAVTDNPLIFPDYPNAQYVDEQVVSAGHFHGMPLALAMSYLKAAIPSLAAISERRINKLIDPATNDGLPAFLTGNEDATDSGFMIVQYTAAALVNDLATRAHPASVYSIPTSANAEDHVSMGANEARHVLDMLDDVAHVIALELYTAAQALDYRRDMLHAAKKLALKNNIAFLQSKISNPPATNSPHYQQFQQELIAFNHALADMLDIQLSPSIENLLLQIRAHIDFMAQDRAMNSDIQKICALVIEEKIAVS